MFEFFAAVFGIVVVAFVVIAFPVLAIVAYSKARDIPALRAKIDELESKLAALERVVRELRADLRGAPPQPPPTRAPSPTPEVKPPVVSHEPAVAPAPPVAPIRPAAQAPPPPRLTIDWERWVGIRGAAVLGGVALSLAALLFFQYSIQRGLITPPMRVALGVGVGLGCLLLSEWLRPRGYRASAEGIAGAGIVCLYAAFWAAHVRYGLLGTAVTFLMMAMITVACCLLAVRHSSQTVAILGLLGGFATPLLVRSEADRPIGLFGYVLLLDLGLLAIGRKMGWSHLSVLSLLGTVLIQGLWIRTRMGPEQALLGLSILALFVLLFAFFPEARAAGAARDRLASQAGSIAFAVLFAVYFASRADLGPHLWPLALFLAILAGAAGWVGARNGAPWFGTGAAAGALAVVLVWMFELRWTPGLAWELILTAVGLSAVFHLFVELDPDTPGADGPAFAAVLAACGFAGLTLVAAGAAPGLAPWPWLLGWLSLAALLYRHAAFPKRAPLQIVAAAAAAFGASLLHLRHAAEEAFPRLQVYLGALVALALLAQLVALARKHDPVRRFAQHAAAGATCLLLALLVTPHTRTLPFGLLLLTLLALAVLAVVPASRLRSGPWYAAAVLCAALAHWTLVMGTANPPVPSAAGVGLLFFGATVVLFSAWPLLVAKPLAAERLAVHAAALSGALWFLPLRRLFVARFGEAFVGALPVALAAISLGGAFAAWRLWPAPSAEKKRALVWFSAVAVSLATVAIPLQLEREWITVGFALEGLGLLALWRKLDHPGLKYFALGVLAVATVRLVANPALLSYYPRSGVPIFNWILYTYLVPAGALLASARLLRPVERARAWPGESGIYAGGRPVGAVAAGLAAIAVIFVWLNLAVADYFTEGPALTLRFGRLPARDLTLSIVWAVYAIGLLLIGMFKNSVGLRWLSLGFLVVTIGKVFLYDLGELRELYRVASLVGLAVSLILVSLLYQRFVFRKTSGPQPQM